MKKLNANLVPAKGNFLKSILVTILLIGASFYGYSQVRKPFTPRASDFTPNKTVYSVKGDFTMIGNTNLTLENYRDNRSNSNNDMEYVDVDGDPSTYNSSMARLNLSTENGANPSCSNIIYAGLYWTGRNLSSNFTNLQRRTIKFKGPGQSYQTLVADVNDINFPGDDGMFAGYVEVTNLVQNAGTGDYYVADIALSEGDGGSTGYYGGWGMVVIYENSKMKWRDITVFDGYAYVQGNATVQHTFDVTGFQAVQNGNVNIKLGMMAGEGDVNITGDYFEILRQSNNQFQRLSHSGNSTTNFFNSSIQTGGNPRNLNRLNNTGLDIAMFDVPNNNNDIIDNNQTSTRFRYGSTQDTYIIFNTTFAVDAYVPDAEGILVNTAINNNPNPTPFEVLPGQVVDYEVTVRNKGNEAINNAVITLPIPYTATYNNLSINYSVNPPVSSSVPAPYFNPTLGATGSIVWEIGTLPVPNNVNDILATLSFELVATTDCALLVNANCGNDMSLLGSISGVGGTSQTTFNQPLIQGYQTNGACIGEPIPTPTVIPINSTQFVNDNCANFSAVRDFFYCNIGTTPIPVSDVSGEFPPGTKFYNEYPLTPNSILYNTSNPFPAVAGTYYAVPPGASTCYYEFTINIEDITSTPISAMDATYCVGETASPLSATASNSNYILVYYEDTPNAVPQASITPSTTTPGVYTYYVAEGIDLDCVSPNRIPITVTVYETISITLDTNTPTSCANTSTGALEISVTGGSGNYTFSWDDAGNSTTQNISNLSTGTYTVIVNDVNSSCSATATFDVLIEDNTPPTIIAPNAFSLEGCLTNDLNNSNATALPYSETISIITEAQFTAEGGTFTEDNVVSITYQDTVSGSCPLVINRVFTITDECGASASATQTITINAPPSIVNIPENLTLDGCDYETQAEIDLAFSAWLAEFSVSGGCSITGSYGTPTAPILCSGGTTTVTFTATDACETTNTVRTFSVTAPTPVSIITPATDLTIECDGNGNQVALDNWLTTNGGAVASDDCSAIVWTNNFTNFIETCGASGSATVVFTATDACGNETSTTATFTIQDTLAPVAPAAPADVTYECISEVPVAQELTATDNCGGTIMGVPSDVVDNTDACNIIITRTWTFTDACNNTSSVSQTITVSDTTAPVAPAAPADVTYECISEVPVAQELTATDNCGGTIIGVSSDVIIDSDVCNIKITRTWTFTDACDNTSSVSQTITVSDTTAPIAPNAPADVTYECISEVPVAQELTATDNCGGTIIGVPADVVDNTDACNIIITRTWTFTDSCDNTSTVSQTITVADTTAPVVPAAPADVTYECISEVPVAQELTATDNCGGTIMGVSSDVVDNTDACNILITRTWTFTDACDNTSSVSQTITVSDTTAPVAPNAPADVTYECISEVPVAQELTATDNCGGTIIGVSSDVVDNTDACNILITRTWTFTDACDNTSS
ncbi:hypothetical protein ACFSQP_04440, partial [Bizionia sediminis]